MEQSTLQKFKHKVRLSTTGKHPLYFEPEAFRICYGAACMLHARLKKNLPPSDNHELMRLFTRGFCFSATNMGQLFSLSKNENKVLEDLSHLLSKRSQKVLFLLDLLLLSWQNGKINDQERESISVHAKLLGITPGEVSVLSAFISLSLTNQMILDEELIAVITQLELRELGNRYLLGYYAPVFDQTTTICANSVRQGKQNRFIDACTLTEDLDIGEGTVLHLTNVTLKLYGQLRLMGGTLIIEDSTLINKKRRGFDDIEKHPMIYMDYENSSLTIRNTQIDCRYNGSFLLCENGTVTITKSKLQNSSGLSSILLDEGKLSVSDCEFRDCHTTQDGAAICIQNGKAFLHTISFFECKARNGGAILAKSDTIIKSCIFYLCQAIEFGAAIYYEGEVRSNVENCEYYDCSPEKEELIQILPEEVLSQITREYTISIATIISKPTHISDLGVLEITDCTVYLESPILCEGVLNIRNAKIVNLGLEDCDMFQLNRSRICSISYSEFDGNDQCGIFHASGTRLILTQSIFRNVVGGRAIFDANTPSITNCIFSNCQSGAVYCRNGKIHHCIFINCRAKNGAAILMYGKTGVVENCQIIRCTSSYGKEAIDVSGSYHVVNCRYED